MQATARLASFAAEVSPDSLPAGVFEQSQRLILDTLGVALGGACIEAAQPLLDEVVGWGGSPEATILVRGERTSAVQAAYANAYLASLLDADETFLNYAHIANAVVPAALAVAERLGSSGRDLLTAVAAGYEVAARIGLSYRMWRLVDGHPEWTAVAGYSWVVFGVTAAAGRLLGLSPGQLASAFGIAGYSTPAPTIGKWIDSTALPHTKYVFISPLAQAGVAAALLAARGFEGDDDVLDGEGGFWRIAGSDVCNWDAMLDGLGARWHLQEVSFKLYPACRFLHGPLDLFARLLAQERLAPWQIRKVVVRMPSAATRPYFCNPDPRNAVEGSFSAPHTFACLAYRVPLGPIWHTAQTLQRPDLAQFRARVLVEVEPTATAAITEQITAGSGVSYYRRCPTSLSVETEAGSFGASTDYASGDPWTPATRLSTAALEEKFMSYATPSLGVRRAREALQRLRALETAASISEVAAALRAS